MQFSIFPYKINLFYSNLFSFGIQYKIVIRVIILTTILYSLTLKNIPYMHYCQNPCQISSDYPIYSFNRESSPPLLLTYDFSMTESSYRKKCLRKSTHIMMRCKICIEKLEQYIVNEKVLSVWCLNRKISKTKTLQPLRLQGLFLVSHRRFERRIGTLSLQI